MAESMKDFETELEQSFQVIKEGDVLEVEVIGISETELTVDLISIRRESFRLRNAVMILHFR